MISFGFGFALGVISTIVFSCMVASSKESRREEKEDDKLTIIKCNENTILEQNSKGD